MLQRTFKMPLFITLIVAFIFSLSACDNHNASDQDLKNQSQESNTDSMTSDSNTSTTKQDSLKPEVSTQPSVADRAESPTPVAPKRTIDLSLPEDWDAGNEAVYDVPEEKVLPNLFSDKKKTKNVNLDGKVLKDEKNEDYIDAIEGAEVSVEVKL